MDTLALHFHVTKSAIVWTMTATLAMRPVGAIVFGLLADRYGRRKPSHGECSFLFRGRTAVRICSQLHRVSNPAHHLRHRHGRRVGRRGFSRHGKCSAKMARDPLRNRAERIFHRLFAGGRGRTLRSARLGMACHVLGRWRAGSAGLLHPFPGARIGGLETTPCPDREGDSAHRQRSLEDFSLSCPLDDAHDVSLPRHPGPLSRLPEIGARISIRKSWPIW